jgi:hypothetical protein
MNNMITSHGIANEWNSLFTKDEIKIMDTVYDSDLKNTDPNSSPLVDVKLSYLTHYLSWFSKPQYFNIGEKIIHLCEKYLTESKRIIDIHFYYNNKMKFYYSNRDTNPNALNIAIDSCLKQIEIAEQAIYAFKHEERDFFHGIPGHAGYKQLSIIYDKQGKYSDVIKICEKAKKEGWSGDWDNRITKAKKKLDSKK